MTKYFWISWYQPTDDHRPLSFPPNENVLGWWCTGERCDDNAGTLCAMVKAENESHAKMSVRADWPEANEWRFCDETDDRTVSDRFPLAPWMELRFANG